MKQLLILLMSFFSSASIGGDQNKGLIEFSTSMDFEEFNVVLKYLNLNSNEFGYELSEIIKKFKESTQPGDAQQVHLEGGRGHITLEREDEYSFGIASFTTDDKYSQLNNVYEAAIKELNI